jgi:hypothetical protein
MSPFLANPFALAVLTAIAGVLMSLAGIGKKALRRKEPQPRCRTCGRTDRWNCACHR